MMEPAPSPWDRIGTYADSLSTAPPAPTRFDWTPDLGDGPDLEVFGTLTGTRVIELGCGDGTNAAALAVHGANVCGVDSSAVQIARARRYWGGIKGLLFTQLDARRLDTIFAAGQFDAVVSVFGAVQFATPAAVLIQARRVLRAGGQLALSIRHPPRDDESTLSGPEPEPRKLVIPTGEMVDLTFYNASISGWLELLHRTGFTDLDASYRPRQKDSVMMAHPNWDAAGTLLVHGIADHNRSRSE